MIDSAPSLVRWLVAASPILVVLILMVGFRWGGSKAGPAGWLVALLVGAFVFKGDLALLAYSQVEGLFLSLYVLYIIWMALVLFRIVEKAQAIQVIGRGVTRLARDPLLQLLILAWVFSSFLQGVAGFGVPIAVVAPLLIGLGFSPVLAVAGTAIGHSWSVTFGDIASSFNALIASTGMAGEVLAPSAAAFLGVACFGCGIALVHAYGGWRALRKGAVAILLIGGSMATTQYLLATNGLWNLAGFVAGIVGMVVGALVTRLPLYRADSLTAAAPESPAESPVSNPIGLGLAMLPYLILIVLVTAAELWNPLHELLNHVKVAVPLPEVTTGLGWTTPARTAKTISLFGHAGALLAYTSVLTFVIYTITGHTTLRDLPGIWRRTRKSAWPSTVGIVSMVGMATAMSLTGMTFVLAKGLSSVIGSIFPFMSSFIGLLGAFMTGSNTNSNVIFAPLQKNTAEIVAVSVLVILGAQTTGGALGSMIAPAKLIVGSSTCGLEGKEGNVLRVTLPYGLLITAVIGILALLFAQV